MKTKLVIIGLDGVPYGLIKSLANKDIMPEAKKIIESGTFRKMESSIPEVSSVAWSSIITGKNPGEHGIFGYTDIPIGTYRLTFPNFKDLKAKPFWENSSGARSVIMNVPSTFPVKPMKGIHISGFVSLDIERSVYPQALIPKLKNLDYRIDVDASKAHKSIEMFLNDLKATLKARIETFRLLWTEEEWETFMIVFTGTDRLSHFLWNAYENANHKYHSAFLDHFRSIDNIIGEISESIFPDDILILISDHGFDKLDTEVNINHLLKQYGFLKLNPNSKRGFADIDQKTKAFGLEPSRINLNIKNKYPRGSVKESEVELLKTELTALFSNLEYKRKKVIKKIHRKEEIYRGKHADQAPDLVLIPNKGFNLRAKINGDKLFEKSDLFTGMHTQDNAFILINKKQIRKILPNKITVSDVIHIAKKIKEDTNA